MHQCEVPAAGIGLLPGKGGFKQDGAAVQEIVARRVILIDSNTYILERRHSQDGTVSGQGAIFHLQAQELLRKYLRTDPLFSVILRLQPPVCVHNSRRNPLDLLSG